MVGLSLNSSDMSWFWIFLLGGLYAVIIYISFLSVDTIMAMASKLIISGYGGLMMFNIFFY
jgi:hypothetical protein